MEYLHRKYCTSSIRVHFPFSYDSLPESKFHFFVNWSYSLGRSWLRIRECWKHTDHISYIVENRSKSSHAAMHCNAQAATSHFDSFAVLYLMTFLGNLLENFHAHSQWMEQWILPLCTCVGWNFIYSSTNPWSLNTSRPGDFFAKKPFQTKSSPDQFIEFRILKKTILTS